MSIAVTDQSTPILGARTPVVDPATAVARTRSRTTVAETISQTFSMALRALQKMRRNPEQFFDVTLQPLLFTAMLPMSSAARSRATSRRTCR